MLRRRKVVMNCISPPELDDGRLSEYWDGEADEETTRHLEKCQYCREKANVLGQLQEHLRARLYRITCPSPLELGEYYLRILSAPQMLVIRQHLSECPHCESEIAQLESYLSDLGARGEQGFLKPVRILVARLVGANEAGSLAIAPLRGESKGPITLEADGIVITLDVQPGREGHLSILGQVAADDQDHWTGALVELRQAGTPELTASLDDLGAFRFDAIRPGSTKLTITSSDGVAIETPEIDLTT